ncbi:hypothetical protein AgCh_018985 [Apium graveolens]
MADFQSYIIFFVVSLVSIIILRALFKNRTSSGLPPGPIRLPVIGHLHLLGPRARQALHRLSNQYGPLIHLYLGSYPCVIVSSSEIAKEFLKTQEAYWLDRPQTVATQYLGYGSQNLMFSPYGPYWKFVKKLIMSELLGGRTLDLLQTVRCYEIRSMINVMLKKSVAAEAVDVGVELTRLTNNVISSKLMKKRCSENEDEAGEIRNLIKELLQISGIFNLSDYIWFCKNLDLQGIKKRLADVRGKYDRMMDKIIEEHRHARMRRQENGGAEDAQDFLDLILEMYEDDGMETKLGMDNIKAIILVNIYQP